MWSQDWSALYPIVTEFQDVPELDVTNELVAVSHRGCNIDYMTGRVERLIKGRILYKN